jgi:uncharacterized membrane protein YdbT with pleckstrin-like domain
MTSTPDADHEETILWSVSQWHYAGKWFLIAVLLTAIGGTFYVTLGDDPSTMWIIRGGQALVAIVILVWINLDRRRRKYIVTNKRVSVEYGIISKRSNELRI